MDFIDNTGHIFSLPHYSTYPEGYLYDENKYIFWMENEYNTSLSVDCFYIKPIRLLLNYSITDNLHSLDNLNIKIEKSNHYRLLSPNKIQNLLESSNNFLNNKLDYIAISESKDLVKELNYNKNYDDNDLIVIDNLVNRKFYYIDNDSGEEYVYIGEVFEELQIDKSVKYSGKIYTCEIGGKIIFCDNKDVLFDINNSPYTVINGKKYDCSVDVQELQYIDINYLLIPFYVVSYVKEEGSWMTNILINVNNDEYCPITVGGSYKNEQEELVINAHNMGIKLPKDIVRAFYDNSFYNDSFDNTVWNQKLKEYLINYMKLRGELGNYRNVINSINWFGYGKNIDIYKLLQIDNQFIEQYITDNFNVNSDIINSFSLFKSSTYISLGLKEVTESNVYNEYDFNNEFYGENKPKLIDLFKTVVEEKIDNTDISFYRQYYDFTFNELALKLSCLKYYLEKYFLPIHIKINRSSLTHQCFASDIKSITSIRHHINANHIDVFDKNILVNFPIVDNTLWISNQIHYIDDNFNEFTNYKYLSNVTNDFNLYYLEDICFSLPIEFSSNNKEQYYNVSLLLFRNNEQIYESKFNFYNSVSFFYYINDEKIEYTGLYSDIITSTDQLENVKKYYFINSDGKKIELFRELQSDSDYHSLVVYPKILSESFNQYTWLNSEYTLMLLVNNNWYEYSFKIKMPELNIKTGKLEYIYNYNLCKQFSKVENGIIKFNASMYHPELVTVNNINFNNELTKYMIKHNLYYTSENISILRNNIYYYYINKNGYNCIFSILDDKYHVLTCDPNYGNYNQTNNDEVNNNGVLVLYQDLEHRYPEQFEELKRNIIENNIYSSIYKNIISFVDLYKENITLPNTAKNIFNKVHLFNIIKLNENNEKEYIKYDSYRNTSNKIFSITIEDPITNKPKRLTFGDNSNVYSLYMEMFDIEGNLLNDFEFFNNKTNMFEIDKSLRNDYDFYLMHDDEYWYGIMISKYPITNNSLYDIYHKMYRLNSNLYLEYVRSDKKFLVNRVRFIDSNGINQYSENDIIVCKLENDNLPINMSLGQKWTIKPLSLGINNFDNIGSNANMCIISIGDNIKYNTGYYEIKVGYALDNKINNYQERTTKILVK